MFWSDLEGILFGEGVNSRQHNKKSSENEPHFVQTVLHIGLERLSSSCPGTKADRVFGTGRDFRWYRASTGTIVLLLYPTKFELLMLETGCEVALEYQLADSCVVVGDSNRVHGRFK